MKLSLSLPADDVAFLDGYAALHELGSRSAAVHSAVAALRLAELADAYGEAWEEWESGDDAVAWRATIADGI